MPAKLTIECNELWSFVDSKKYEIYIWIALNRNSRKIIGCYVGDRTRKSARKLWDSLPDVYQQSDESLHGFLASVTLQLFLLNVQRAVGKETGLTNHVERLNNTFRQRVSRLVRASLSFSKKLNNHIGAIWYFLHGYNAELERI